jgi:hypothetical protein
VCPLGGILVQEIAAHTLKQGRVIIYRVFKNIKITNKFDKKLSSL